MSRSPRPVRSFLVVLGLVAFLPATTSAYVREVTSAGAPIAWNYPCVTLHFFVGSAPPLLTSTDYAAAAAQAAATWSYPQLACTDIRLAMVPVDAPAADVGNVG